MDALSALIPKFVGQKVAVVGDVILDEYLFGAARRMSREAPIPVLEFVERRIIGGGACNPAANIVALGGVAWQVGVVGDDPSAHDLLNLLKAQGIRTQTLLTCDDGRPPPLKTRLLAHLGWRCPQQVARMDTLSRAPITPAQEARLRQALHEHASTAQAILCSDYDGGLLTSALVRQMREQFSHALLTADAQGNLDKYLGFDLVKCNADDAQRYLDATLSTDADFAHAASALCRALDLRGAMVITRGADGATLATAEGTAQTRPAPTVRDVYDTVGAGDTAIAVMTLARLAGAEWAEAVMLANVASGVVVQHMGNYAPTPDDLRTALA